MCKRLILLDIHPALRVLRSSISAPRFQYILRTSPTFVRIDRLKEIDEFYRRTLEAITNNKINDTSWTQSSSPLSFAGLGIRKLVDLAHPAYFSSLYQSQPLSDQILSKLNSSIFTQRNMAMLEEYPPELTPESPQFRASQRAWDILKVKTIHSELLSSSGPIDRARLLASSTKSSSKWLQAVPSHQLGLLLDNDTSRIAVALRFGTCNKTKAKYFRHAQVNKTFSMAFSAAGVPNNTKPHGLSRRDGKRPVGLTSYPWSNGKSLSGMLRWSTHLRLPI